jgi:glycosyltransferase involved in cell wall biosynthesis
MPHLWSTQNSKLRTQNWLEMIIALDGHMIGSHETGNETYALELALALARLDAPMANDYSYKLYTARPGALPAGVYSEPRLSVREFPDVPSLVRIPRTYPRLVREDGAALLHMQYVAPPFAPCPVVLTVHDVSHRIYPEFFSLKARLVVTPLTGMSIRRATHIIASSMATLRDLVRYYRVPQSRVTVVPLAAGCQYQPRPQEEQARVQALYNLPASYVLSVGTMQPRKNLGRLIEAFGSIAAEIPEVALVIAGAPTSYGSELEQKVRQRGLGGRVRFIGYVPEADLPALYSGATVFCYPSLYEGFGLPPLEAMACGAPTVTSNTSSLPEVVGDAALMVNPTSVESISFALRQFLQDPELRDTYGQKGLQRAASFSWQRTAQLTRDVYDQVVSCQLSVVSRPTKDEGRRTKDGMKRET